MHVRRFIPYAAVDYWKQLEAGRNERNLQRLISRIVHNPAATNLKLIYVPVTAARWSHPHTTWRVFHDVLNGVRVCISGMEQVFRKRILLASFTKCSLPRLKRGTHMLALSFRFKP